MEKLKFYKRVTNNGKTILLHRYLMEQHLGRQIMFNEIVHHEDGDIFNNNISNLKIFSRSKHSAYHKSTGLTYVKLICAYCESYFLREKRNAHKECKSYCCRSHQVKHMHFLGLLKRGHDEMGS